MIDTNTNPLPDMTDALKEVKGYAKGGEVKKKNGERWQDDDCDGKWYEKTDVDGKISKREKKEKGKHYSKEEVEQVDERHVTASMGRHAKKWREEQARKKDRADNAKWEEKARTHKWDGKTWNKRDKPTHEKGTGPHARKAAESVEYDDVKEAMLLTKADKKGNTPAWQNRDKKNVKTGEPLYKKADHLKKEEVEIETLKKMELFSDDEIQSIVDKMDFTGEE